MFSSLGCACLGSGTLVSRNLADTRKRIQAATGVNKQIRRVADREVKDEKKDNEGSRGRWEAE